MAMRSRIWESARTSFKVAVDIAKTHDTNELYWKQVTQSVLAAIPKSATVVDGIPIPLATTPLRPFANLSRCQERLPFACATG